MQRWLAADSKPMQVDFPWIALNAKEALGSINVGLLVDNLSAAMLLMVSFVGLCIQVYSASYIDTEIKHFPTQDSSSMSRFFGWLSLFSFAMLGLVLSSNLLQIYIFWELVGVCSYLLIGFWYFKDSAAQASKKAFIVTRFGDLGFLCGILLLGLSVKEFGFLQIANLFGKGVPAELGNGLAILAAILIFCGAVGKSAQFPLHIWLPDAMEGPTPVSALIHAATMVAAGVYLVARIMPVFMAGGLPTEAGMLIAYTGAITAVFAASIAMVQNDVKRVLAYSTISQLGFMMCALGIGAFTAGSFHLLTHAFFKALLFLGSGALIVACHSNDMWHMGGLRKALPITWFTFLMGALALTGIPPFAGFWSKDEILTAVYCAPNGLPLFAILTLAAIMTAFYVTRLYFITFEGQYRGAAGAPADLEGPVPPTSYLAPQEPSEVLSYTPQWTEAKAVACAEKLSPGCMGAAMEHVSHQEQPPHEVSPLMWGPLVILALFAFGLGLVGIPTGLGLGVPNYFEHFINSELSHAHQFSLVPMIVSLIGALFGITAATVFYAKNAAHGERYMRFFLGPVWRWCQQKWYMDHIWAWLLANTMYLGAKIAAWVDTMLVDGAVFGLAAFTKGSGQWLSLEHNGKVQHILLVIVMSLAILAIAIGYIEPNFITSPHYWMQVFSIAK